MTHDFEYRHIVCHLKQCVKYIKNIPHFIFRKLKTSLLKLTHTKENTSNYPNVVTIDEPMSVYVNLLKLMTFFFILILDMTEVEATKIK